ncbi:MAG: hypothetical protein KAJ19_08020, partial [Gammaproteobacteria bacterium]|nr:hypothetical protein [Gammaproteobacteria bacterium]
STGHKPDNLARRYEPSINISKTALTLGSSTHKVPVRDKIKWELLERTWVDANWEPFLRHAEQGKGFLYAPSPTSRPEEVAYAFMDKGAPKVSYAHALRMTVEMPYMGIVD